MKKFKMLVTAITCFMVWRYIRYQKVEIEIARFDYMMRIMKEKQDNME